MSPSGFDEEGQPRFCILLRGFSTNCINAARSADCLCDNTACVLRVGDEEKGWLVAEYKIS